ncbi:MAG: hypothetical protein KDK36_09490, partial [Leptospiraceae bacterium]|nr:hypothetical protein [Leptospiraceae bacterium]
MNFRVFIIILSLIFSNCITNYVKPIIPPPEEPDLSQGPIYWVKTEIISLKVDNFQENIFGEDEIILKNNINHLEYLFSELKFFIPLKEDEDSRIKIKITGYVPDSTNTPLSGLLTLLTLGVIPLYFDKDRHFRIDVFNKEKIVSSRVYVLEHKQIMGWVSIFLTIFVSPFVDSMYDEFEIAYINMKAFKERSKPLVDLMVQDTKKVLYN